MKTKKATFVLGIFILLTMTAIGCVEKEEKIVTQVVLKTEVMTEMQELDTDVEVEEVTLEMLNTRLAELVVKYEGTSFKEADMKKVLAEANNSFMSENTLFDFLEITCYEELEPFAYGEELYNACMVNIEEKKQNPDYELIIFDVGDLFFNDKLISTGNFISQRILDVESKDQEKSMAAARDLVFYYGECMPEGAIIEKAPISRNNIMLDNSAGLYINGFYGYAIAILCREEIELEQIDSMKIICNMWGDYDQSYEFYFILKEKGVIN